MSAFALGLWSFPALLALIALRVPIGAAMLAVGIAGGVLATGRWTPILAQLKSLPVETFSSYSLSIVPLFLLMGQFAARGGLSAALFRAARAWLGGVRGGLPIAAIGACAAFGAVCGSSLATAAAMGRVALPELRAAGVSPAMATGTIAAGGTLGILIPPSVALVIYALITEQNIAKLFMAAMIPGLLAALGYMGVIAVWARLRPGDGGAAVRADRAERRAALRGAWPAAALFIAVVGGIYGGVFTPTEAAAVGAAGAGAAAFASGMGLAGFRDALADTAQATAMIFFILLGAAVYNAFLAGTQVPQGAAAWASGLGLEPLALIALILLGYLALGCVMDSLSMILLTTPVVFPVVIALDLGLSPEETALWFGVLALVAVEVGLITPPVGMNLFVVNGMAGGAPLRATWAGVAPFVLSDVARLAVLVAAPGLSLWLVRALW